jgi:hypothetical protein
MPCGRYCFCPEVVLPVEIMPTIICKIPEKLDAELEAVISAPIALVQIDRFLVRGWIQLPFRFAAERENVMKLMRTYRDVPMSFADACLVRMAELQRDVPVFTLDKDFLVYRKNGREVIATITPP